MKYYIPFNLHTSTPTISVSFDGTITKPNVQPLTLRDGASYVLRKIKRKMQAHIVVCLNRKRGLMNGSYEEAWEFCLKHKIPIDETLSTVCHCDISPSNNGAPNLMICTSAGFGGDWWTLGELLKVLDKNHWEVFMIELGDGSIHTEATRDVKKRYVAHERGERRDTRKKGVKRLLWQSGDLSEAVSQRMAAFIKTLKRKDKKHIAEERAVVSWVGDKYMLRS